MRPNLALVVGEKHRPPSRLDWATVEQALTSNGNDDDPRTLKFQRLLLDKLFSITALDADEYITDGGDDCGVDLFVIDDNNNNIHLVSTKTVDGYDKAKKNYPGAEVTKLICFVRDFVGKIESLLTRCNPLLRAKVVQAWELIDFWPRFSNLCPHLLESKRVNSAGA